MTEPVTSNVLFIVPNTGDLPGAWGTSALNPNFQSIDTKFGGVTTISLSATTTILLTTPATTGVWPGGNPSQSMNALIRFTGAQTGSATIQFTLPGFYIIENRCTGTTFVKLSPSSGGGNSIGAPPGEKIHVFYDGTDMDYVDMGRVGSALDLTTNTTTLPPWMTACSVQPYLIKDGSIYSTASYTALAQYLGSTYGGNGITTFGVPDERNRMRVAIDTVQPASGTTSQRITVAGSNIVGTSFVAGGSQTAVLSLSQLPTGIVVTGTLSFAGGRKAPTMPSGDTVAGVPAPATGSYNAPYITNTWGEAASVGGSLTSNNTNGSSHAIVPPIIIDMLALIKT